MKSSPDRLIYLKNTYTGHFPMTYHETGSPEKRTAKGVENHLPYLVTYILQMPRMNLGCPKDLTIVTWNNYEESILEDTAKHQGIPVKVYGKGIPWTTNYETKTKLMRDACAEATTKYVLGVDSRDLVFLTSPSVILDEFKRMQEKTGIKMLFGATIKTSGFYKDCPDLLHMFRTLPRAQYSLFRNLNGGQWIAERDHALNFFTRASTYPPRSEKPASDQMILSHTLCYNSEFQKTIILDYECRIFQIYTNVIKLAFFYEIPKNILIRAVVNIRELIESRYIYVVYLLDRNPLLKNVCNKSRQLGRVLYRAIRKGVKRVTKIFS